MAVSATTAAPPADRLILRGVSWKTYQHLLEDFGDRSAPRFAYDRGVLEIASPTPKHEKDHFSLTQVVLLVVEESGIDYLPVGSTTYHREYLQQGFEADSSFYITNQRYARDLEEFNPKVDPPPDLVIEADVTHSSLDKLPIFAGFGVPEVWRSRSDWVAILVLEGGAYRAATSSRVLPQLTADVLSRFMVESRTRRRLDWVREVRSWAQAQQRGDAGL